MILKKKMMKCKSYCLDKQEVLMYLQKTKRKDTQNQTLLFVFRN